MDMSYRGATAILATMHGKERVIAPAMRRHLGLDVRIEPGLNTDVLGTFTGEIPRKGSMRDVAIRKARMGMRASGLSIGLASEGTYGAHPTVPFLRAGMELMVFIDAQRDVIITESLVTEETVHDETVGSHVGEVGDFLRRVRFPEQGLVVAPNLTESPWWKLHPELAIAEKGVTSHQALSEAIARAAGKSEDGRARVATDMRAHMNPTRMRAIAELADTLARRIARQCPECLAPGFGEAKPAPGLPCISCGTETIASRGLFLSCQACGYRKEELTENLPAHAPPAECPQCNP